MPGLSRRFWIGALLVVGLVLIAVWFYLRSEAFERRVLASASTGLERALGLRVETDSAQLGPLGGSIDLAGVKLRNAEGATTAAARRVRGTLRLLPLLQRRVELTVVEIEGLSLDLSAWPEPKASVDDAGEESVGWQVILPSVRIREGELTGISFEERGPGWPTSLRFSGVEIEGSILDEELVVSIAGSNGEVARTQQEPVHFRLMGELGGPLAGPYRTEDARLDGPEVSLALGGTVGIAPEQPMALTVRGWMDPGSWLPAEREARIEVDAELDLRAAAGRLVFGAPEVPFELLEGWLEPELARSLNGSGTVVGLDGDLRLGPERLDRLTGELAATWRRGSEELARLAVEPAGVPTEGPMSAAFELSLAPHVDGRRFASGVLELVDGSIDSATVEGGRLEIEFADLGREVAGLAARWPAVLGGLASLPSGPLEAEGTFNGAALSPTVELRASWRPGPESRVTADYVGEPLRQSGRLAATFDQLNLEKVSEDMSGAVDGTVAIDLGARWRGRFDLRAENLRAGGLEDAQVVASGSLADGRLALSELGLDWQGHVVEGAGELVRTQDGARLEFTPVTIDGVTAELTADLPGVLLDSVPEGVFGRWRTVESRERRLRLAWQMPRSDLAPLTEGRADRLEAASRGELLVDLDRPALSSGRATIADVTWRSDEWQLEGLGPIELSLADARLSTDEMSFAAPVTSLELQSEVALEEAWAFGDEWASLVEGYELRGGASVGDDWVGVGLGLNALTGLLDLNFEVTRRADAVLAELTVDGRDSSFGISEDSDLRLSDLDIGVRLLGDEWTLDRFSARLADAQLGATGNGRWTESGLEVSRLTADIGGVRGEASGFVPIGSEPGKDELRLEWDVPESDLSHLLARLDLVDSEDSVRAGSSGELLMSLSKPTSAVGLFEVSGFEWKIGGGRTVTSDPLRVRVGGGRAVLEPLTLLSEGRRFELSGELELAREWNRELGISGLVVDTDLRGDGTLVTSVLQPFLSGSVGEGVLDVQLQASGPPERLTGTLSVEGPEASLSFTRPYATRISDPRFAMVFDRGGIASLSGRLGLNDGAVELSGGREESGEMTLEARLEEVRYRLDYGLLALLNGNLGIESRSAGEWSIVGDVEVKNGILTRDIDLDLGLIQELLTPVDLTSTEESPLEAIELDLTLRTAEGIRVQNNVADALILWDPVRIRGNLAAPVVDGRFDVEPGGRVRAFGQTVRIDSASLHYPGVGDLPPTLDLKTTSSLEDPSISNLASKDPFASERELEDSESNRLSAAASGLGEFYGERLANRVTQSLSGATVSFEPVLIFGETDPGTRMTVSQPFSPQVTVAASVDLRNAEQRTYVLDLHAIEQFPGLQAQAFTNDEKTRGGVLRQKVELGPGGKRKTAGPKIRKLMFELPPGIKKRRIKRNLSLGKGDRLAAGAIFAAEVEVGEYLRNQGWTDARVRIRTEDVPKGVAVWVVVEPGPRAQFVFEGEKLPKPLRRLLEDLYRSDYYEPAAIEEMKVEGRRALRSLGFLDPAVDVAVAPTAPQEPKGDRIVTISLSAGRRIELESIVFEPLPAGEAALLSARFSRPVRRVELAAGLPEADRRVQQTLESFGYREPRIVERHLSEDGSSLRVIVETGARPTIAEVAIEGVESADAERLEGLLGLSQGDPVRPDRVASAAIAIRNDLRARSFTEVSVESHIESLEGDPERRRLRFAVDRGASHFVSEVAFEGLRSTKPKFAKRVADVELESDYSEDAVSEARRRLWRTRAFESVTAESIRAPGGDVRLRFDVAERRRYEFGYGVRWDNDTGIGLLTELIDRNALGRAWTLGLRALWSEDDQELRGFAGLPRLWSQRSSLGLFAAVREESDSGLLTDTIEGTAQLSYKLSRRLTARLYGRYTETRVREEVPIDPDFAFDQRAARPVLGTQLIYDERRGTLLFRKGLFASIDLSASDDSFGSDFNYSRLYAQGSYYLNLRPRSSRSLIWAQSLRFGVAEPGSGQELVRDDRFFAGGEFSVRGYLTESLGPQEVLGSVRIATGGEALFVINQEFRLQLGSQLTGLVFFDAGNVFGEVSDLEFDLATSAGVGLRALTPIGLLRLDAAHALDRRPFDPEYKIYFGFGTSF